MMQRSMPLGSCPTGVRKYAILKSRETSRHSTTIQLDKVGSSQWWLIRTRNSGEDWTLRSSGALAPSVRTLDAPLMVGYASSVVSLTGDYSQRCKFVHTSAPSGLEASTLYAVIPSSTNGCVLIPLPHPVLPRGRATWPPTLARSGAFEARRRLGSRSGR